MELAGVLFALTTVQPHFFLLLYALLIIWGITKRKWNFVIWFISGIIILSVIGIFFIPDWVLSYLRILWHFEANFSTTTPGRLLLGLLPGLGKQLGWFFTALMALICGVEWLAVRGKEPRWLFWTACITLVASQWIGLPVDPGEYFILMVPAILIISISAQRTEKSGFSPIGILLVIFFTTPWLIAWRAGLPSELVEPGWVQYFLPPLILLIGLYWIRWWAIRPQRLYIEELRNNETV